MKKRYEEVMDRIKVTDEMRGRILDHIQNMDIEARPARKVIPFPNLKKYMSIAVCFAVLLAGALVTGNMTGIFQPNDPPVQVVNGMAEAGTLEQLAAAVGFEVENLDPLPFEVETTVYISYWDELAEITYTGEGQTATFRKSAGTEDNSGDYSIYSTVKEMDVGSLTVTLKGGDQSYTLATWSDGIFAYSINLSDGISELDWKNLISETFEP